LLKPYHRGNEDISKPKTRLNNLLGLPIITNSTARFLNTALNSGVIDGPLPDLLGEFVLGHHAPLVFQEIGEHVKDAALQFDWLTSAV
jgi:hypothetical protein